MEKLETYHEPHSWFEGNTERFCCFIHGVSMILEKDFQKNEPLRKRKQQDKEKDK
jgi:hypothetical protein